MQTFSVVREEPIPYPEVLLLGTGVELSCFYRRESPADAGRGIEGTPETDAYPLSLTIVHGSTFPDFAPCERFRSQLAARRAATFAEERRSAQDWLKSELASAEGQLSEEEAAARDFAEREGSPEVLERRQRELRKALDAARASGDRAREERAAKEAIDLNLRQIESGHVAREVERARAHVEVFRKRIEEERADAAAPPAVEPCIRSQ
jgi:hypothetical protein